MKAIFETLCGCKREMEICPSRPNIPDMQCVLPLKPPMMQWFTTGQPTEWSPMRVRRFELVRYGNGSHHEIPCAYYMEMQDQ